LQVPDFDQAIRDHIGRPVQASPEVRGFNVTVLGNSISFEADGDGVFALIDQNIFPSLRRQPLALDWADIRIRLVQDSEILRLFIDGVAIASAASSGDLLRGLIDWLDRALVERLTGLHAVHAGAVLIGDKALLLPGASHAGKSSLVAELLRRGAVCFSDEYALLDSEGRVHVYPRALLIRQSNSHQTPVRAEECGARVADRPAKVGWILALQYDRSGNWEVNQVPQSSALLTLLQNTPHVFADRPQMLPAFQRAVELAECYAGRRGEASDAVEQIMNLVSGTSACGRSSSEAAQPT
jgi:hypothetical protein